MIDVIKNMFTKSKGKESKKKDAHWFATEASKEERKKIMNEMAEGAGKDQKKTIEEYQKQKARS
jgi:hypothetical protein